MKTINTVDTYIALVFLILICGKDSLCGQSTSNFIDFLFLAYLASRTILIIINHKKLQDYIGTLSSLKQYGIILRTFSLFLLLLLVIMNIFK